MHQLVFKMHLWIDQIYISIFNPPIIIQCLFKKEKKVKALTTIWYRNAYKQVHFLHSLTYFWQNFVLPMYRPLAIQST